MENSNSIKSALKIITRVNELVNSGIMLKELKSDLRVVFFELANEVPATILVAVDRALHARSLVDFKQRVVWAIEAAESVLRVAEQFDAVHEAALAENARFDWLASRFGIFWFGDNDAVRHEIVERAHHEALHIADELRKEFTSIEQTVPGDKKRSFKQVAAKYILGCALAAFAFGANAKPAKFLDGTKINEICHSVAGKYTAIFSTASGNTVLLDSKDKTTREKALDLNVTVNQTLQAACESGAMEATAMTRKEVEQEATDVANHSLHDFDGAPDAVRKVGVLVAELSVAVEVEGYHKAKMELNK